MYVILVKHKWTSGTGWIIRTVTGSIYTHAAIMTDNGAVYDSSEKKGGVTFRGKLSVFDERQVVIFYVESDKEVLYKKIDKTLGTKYVWKGVFGWLFTAQDKNKFYCFEYVWEILREIGNTSEVRVRTDANDILKHLSNANYVGKAKDWKLV